MGKKFNKRVTKKTKVKLTPRDAEEVFKKEFVDSRGNIMQIIFDFRPHSQKEPTVDWTRKYNKE